MGTRRNLTCRIDDLTIAFDTNSSYTLDVYQLDNLPLESSTADDLIIALSAYQGELLPGFYDEWISVERERISVLFEAKMGRLLEQLQSEGRWKEVLEWGTRWISMGRWPEPAYRALMSAYANGGDIPKAVDTYKRLSQGLEKDLGMKPSEQSQALYKRLKAGWKMDIRRLQTKEQDLQKPGRIWLPASFPLPKVRRSNLPRPLTGFIGREKEIQQIESLVSIARLVTITGSGGVGKTRLAIRAAGEVAAEYRDGVWWVELASITRPAPPKEQDLSHQQDASRRRDSKKLQAEPGELSGADLVAHAVANALRIQDTSGLSLLDEILEYLHDKQLLLVLDNCEHLIEACAALVERTLADCPDVTILATSREALGVPGEKAWSLPTLSLPEPDFSVKLKDIFTSEAVSLFIERTHDVLPGYQPGEADVPAITQICRRLDGIPLAIELAAARMSLLSAQEIAARMDRRFDLLTGGHRTALPRHQTLLAAIEWSHELLSENEVILFQRLSIFAGSFTLKAAEVHLHWQRNQVRRSSRFARPFGGQIPGTGSTRCPGYRFDDTLSFVGYHPRFCPPEAG